MNGPRLSEELAKVVNRLMDRFLPEPVRPRDPGEKAALWLSTFIGALFWWGALVAYLLASSSEFVSSGNLLILTGLSLLACPVFTLLIMTSFDRGRPLTYFFLGLTVPTLSFRILRLGFPF